MIFISPLRYPGGKGKVGPYFARLLADQPATVTAYAEPYAGGAGAGLYLLSEGHIDTLYVNDLNPGIAAFWRAVTNHSAAFIARIEEVELTLEEWQRQRNLYLSPGGSGDLDLGFATFYLNRCNRSGILNARPIGGLEQTGRWKIDARFNRVDLADRVALIASMADSIRVSQLHALKFIAKISRRREPILTYVDPPYFLQGEELYMSMHSWDDHRRLAGALDRTRHPWILTYDVDDRVRKLYPSRRCLNYDIKHTAQNRKVGREYMLFSRGIRVNDLQVVARRAGKWVDVGD